MRKLKPSTSRSTVRVQHDIFIRRANGAKDESQFAHAVHHAAVRGASSGSFGGVSDLDDPSATPALRPMTSEPAWGQGRVRPGAEATIRGLTCETGSSPHGKADLFRDRFARRLR